MTAAESTQEQVGAPRVPKNRGRARLGVSAVAVFGLAWATGTVSPAFADDSGGITTWEDVVAAEQDVQQQKKLIAEINDQISSLDADVKSATDRANAAGTEYGQAMEALGDKQAEVRQLQNLAQAAQASVDESREYAGQIAAAMATRGSGDPALNIFLHPEKADSLLNQLGTLSRLSHQTEGIYTEAVEQERTATQLAEQASSAVEELRVIEAEAKTKYEAAVGEQVALQQRQTEVRQQQSELQAMLAPLQQQRSVTQADYEQGQVILKQRTERELQEQRQAAVRAQEQAYAEAHASAEAAGLPAPEAPPLLQEEKPEEYANAPAGDEPATDATTDAGVNPTTDADAEGEAGAEGESAVETDAGSETETDAGAESESSTQPESTGPQAGGTITGPTAAATQTPEPGEGESTEATESTEEQPVESPESGENPESVPAVEAQPENPVDPDTNLPSVEPYIPEPPQPQPQPGGVLPGYSAPMDGALLSDVYGPRLHPIYNEWRNHNGIDLYVPGGTCGAPLRAVTNGEVVYAGWNGGYGNFVAIESHSGDGRVHYAHIMPGGIAVWYGQTVSAGDIIGYAGTTGDSTGCHLHFEVTQYGSFVDPQPWLARYGIHY